MPGSGARAGKCICPDGTAQRRGGTRVQSGLGRAREEKRQFVPAPAGARPTARAGAHDLSCPPQFLFDS